ncbi:MAG: Arc family DNA-binding protein [Parvularculaceae bacterium]
MKTLTIRQLPDDVHDALRIKAAANGRSMEEEVRQLLADATMERKKPDLGPLRALREKFRKSDAFDGLTAAEAVREMRNEDIAATDAKLARIEADWAAAREKKNPAQ